MAEGGDDFSAHELPHVRIDAVRQPAQYTYPNRPQDRKPQRQDYPAHAQALVQQLTVALGAVPAPENDPRLAIAEQKRGAIVELETQAPRSDRSGPSKTPALDYVAQDIVVLKSTRQDDRTEKAILFIPDDARQFLIGRINAYGNANLGNKKRPDVPKFEPIETITAAQAQSLFPPTTDFVELQARWWELWVRDNSTEANRPKTAAVVNAALQANLPVHEERLKFPDAEVVFVHGAAAALSAFLSRVPGAVWEVRLAEGAIVPILEVGGHGLGQHDWVADLAHRLSAPTEDAPSVCIIDTGLTAAHPLLQPAVAGAWTIDAQWGVDDHHPHGGHGTPMAGMVLHGDLVWRMQDNAPVALSHHVESVKFLPPHGFPPNRPTAYGVVTQSAISVAEIERPNVPRTFCLATSTHVFMPDAPSSWSGAIDQLASGAMDGERDTKKAAASHPKRLMLVAAGNVIGGPRAEVEQHHSIEDPAQSWNALTIGGYTTKEDLAQDLVPLAGANEKSPFSAGTQLLVGDLTPIKPEVLFEAGNMMVDAADMCDWHPAVSLLGTGTELAAEPLVPFWATSAATGLAGNFMGRLKALRPGLWPETYRALAVQSADWPAPIRKHFVGRGAHWKTGSKASRQLLLREVGYGVPSIERAVASSLNDVTLLAEAEIQPFALSEAGGAVFNEMHFYRLPWPRSKLQELENAVVVMKVTLSYFVEPNLSGRAATRPDTYRSFGLRFELKKRLETGDEFHNRLSKPDEEAVPGDVEAADIEEPANEQTPEADYWLLGRGPQAGSLHCDLWRGHAVDLASHDYLAVYPVGGWWKTHPGQKRTQDKARYSLAVSISAEGAGVDLYSEVVTELEAAEVAAAIEVG